MAESETPSPELEPLETILVSKPWYLSKTIMASVATILQGALLVAFGFELTDAEVTAIAGLLLGGGTVITGAISLYGRIKARQLVTLRKPKELN